LQAYIARSAAARTDAPLMVSRELLPMLQECASVAAIGKPLRLGSDRVQPLPIVDVDKSARFDWPRVRTALKKRPPSESPR